MRTPEENKRAGIRKQSNEKKRTPSSSTSHHRHDLLASCGRQIGETPPTSAGSSLQPLPLQSAPRAPPAPGNGETRVEHGPGTTHCGRRRVPVAGAPPGPPHPLPGPPHPPPAGHLRAGPGRAQTAPGAGRPPAARPQGPARSCAAPAAQTRPYLGRSALRKHGTGTDTASAPLCPVPTPLRPRSAPLCPRRGVSLSLSRPDRVCLSQSLPGGVCLSLSLPGEVSVSASASPRRGGVRSGPGRSGAVAAGIDARKTGWK